MNDKDDLAARAVPSAGLSGARSGLADLYARHVGGAEALARLLTGDRDLAEDVAHEAFVRVAGRFGHLRTAGAFEAYLRRTVVNLCRDQFRRARTERAFLRREAPGALEAMAPATDDTAERGELWSAIQALPYRQRAAVVLRFYEDLTERDTAEVLRCSTRRERAGVPGDGAPPAHGEEDVP